MKKIDDDTYAFSDTDEESKNEFLQLLEQYEAEDYVLSEMIQNAAIRITDQIITGGIVVTEEEPAPQDVTIIVYRYLTQLNLLNMKTRKKAWNVAHKAGLPDKNWTYSPDTKLFTRKNDTTI